MPNIITIDELRSLLQQFKGSKCWNVYSCGSAHSLRLSFGRAVEIQVYSMRDQISKIRYHGQYEMFVLCTWRLDLPDRPICSAMCDYDVIKQTASCLMGDTFESIEIFPPFWEATVHFLSGKKLRIFCDNIDEDNEESLDNWLCCDKEFIYNVGCGSRISKMERFNRVSDELYDPEQIDRRFVISDLNFCKNDSEGVRYCPCPPNVREAKDDATESEIDMKSQNDPVETDVNRE